MSSSQSTTGLSASSTARVANTLVPYDPGNIEQNAQDHARTAGPSPVGGFRAAFLLWPQGAAKRIMRSDTKTGSSDGSPSPTDDGDAASAHQSAEAVAKLELATAATLPISKADALAALELAAGTPLPESNYDDQEEAKDWVKVNALPNETKRNGMKALHKRAGTWLKRTVSGSVTNIQHPVESQALENDSTSVTQTTWEDRSIAKTDNPETIPATGTTVDVERSEEPETPLQAQAEHVFGADEW